MNNWDFKLLYNVDRTSGYPVNLPHTWNDVDGTAGKVDYYRGAADYRKRIFIPQSYTGKRLFLRFEGVGTVADLFINEDFVGNHTGGYAAFCFEITDKVKIGKENEILVKVNNAYQTGIIPLEGDFVIYGGIYRPVNLIVAEQSCITPLDFASCGVYLTQRNVSPKSAQVEVVTKVSNGTTKAETYVVRSNLFSKEGKLLKTLTGQVTVGARTTLPVSQQLVLDNPHLWNGTANPYLYKVKVSLWQKERMLDEVVQPLGLRYYSVDPDKGFLLNGEHLALHGVCRHQDRFGKGNALSPEDHTGDLSMIREMGANAIRLSHYQHAGQMYDQCDSAGMVLWSEIPFVGPGGNQGFGYYNTPTLHENVKQQLTELIRQNYNHPSVCFWGLYNELKEGVATPVPFLRELNQLAKQEDPTRLTTSASHQEGDLNFVSDIIAWNKYYGWYSGNPNELGKFLDDKHKTFPKLNIGISEYGAGGSIKHHLNKVVKTDPGSRWHPEEWQAVFHEQNWSELRQRPFVWGSFIWNMFDFASAFRNEGDAPGINDKGLVTFDRKVKKDAFYFYKANWNPEPMVYITSRRMVERRQPQTDIKVYSNCPQVELLVNGRSLGKMSPDSMRISVWPNVTLSPGKNRIEVRATSGKKEVRDACEWVLQEVY